MSVVTCVDVIKKDLLLYTRCHSSLTNKKKREKKEPCCVRWLDSSHMLLLERELLFM